MRVSTIAILFLISAISCNPRNEDSQNLSLPLTTRIYASSVGDSFSIFVSLPEGYDGAASTRYPVVYLTDANFYFEMTASAFRTYASVGLVPPVIVVGIGYRDLMEMDSLRDRDFTYPTAVPEYEMQPSGGGEKFLAFISKELIPRVDGSYRCDTLRRVLIGHSLGGFFVAYALQQQLKKGGNFFSGFIAASPSLHYNNYYLLREIAELPVEAAHESKLRLYVTYGGLEDAEDDDVPGIEPNSKTIEQLSEIWDTSRQRSVIFKGDIFSNLAHMTMAMPSFLKGLPLVLDDSLSQAQ